MLWMAPLLLTTTFILVKLKKKLLQEDERRYLVTTWSGNYVQYLLPKEGNQASCICIPFPYMQLKIGPLDGVLFILDRSLATA